MRKAIIPLLSAAIFFSCGQQGADKAVVKDASTTVATETKLQASEFADPKYMEMGSQGLKKFEERKLEEWVEGFSENAVYQWSSGDSLVGKAAILAFWKKSFENVESLKFANDIWLPIKVNQPQKGPDMPGVWLISWFQTNVKYKNGKSLQFWVHNDLHYDANNKIDRAILYIDNAPINAALGRK
jgi:hypothetical protein